MGCSTSRPLLQTRIQQEKARGGTKRMLVDPREETISHTIDQELNRLRQREEMKVKLLLLGLEGSGKRSIFQQMKYLHGGRPSDEERRTYGVIIRSNVLVTIRELCRRLRYLGLEKALARETADDESDSDLTPKRAYDCIVARTLDASLNCDNREVEMVCKRRTNVLQQLEVLVQVRSSHVKAEVYE